MARYPLQDIRGVIPALVTCFDEAGTFDEARQRAVVRWQLGRGVDGFYLTGSTGEFFMMTPAERMRVVEAVLDEVAGRVPVIVHVGATSTRLTAELASHAQAQGADAISSVPPFFWKFTDAELIEYYREVCEAVSLPMIVYNIALSGLVGYGLILRLARIPGVAGIKYTASTHFEIGRLKSDLGPGFIVYSGSDEMAVSGLAYGADGLIGSFYNLIPELFLELHQAFRRGDLDLARQCQAQANAIVFYVLEHNFMPLLKRAMGWAGADAGFCRRPLGRLTPGDEASAREGLKTIRDALDIRGVAALKAL